MTDLNRFGGVTEEETDGRRRRSAANRQRIIAAMLALVKEGEREPSADLVAARAGVGRRTVFRLFSDMESIYREMNVEFRNKVERLRTIPIEGDTFIDRLKSFAARRTRVLEEMMPIDEAASLFRHRSPTLAAQYLGAEVEMRALFEAQLPPAVRADPNLVEALDLLLSLPVWRRLRRDRHMSPEAALSLLQQMLETQVPESLRA
jgi:AcrR family transcriptional regulator